MVDVYSGLTCIPTHKIFKFSKSFTTFLDILKFIVDPWDSEETLKLYKRKDVLLLNIISHITSLLFSR